MRFLVIALCALVFVGTALAIKLPTLELDATVNGNSVEYTTVGTLRGNSNLSINQRCVSLDGQRAQEVTVDWERSVTVALPAYSSTNRWVCLSMILLQKRETFYNLDEVSFTLGW